MVPLWPGHLVPGSLCRGQQPPPPASPSRARAGAVECTGSRPPAPAEGATLAQGRVQCPAGGGGVSHWFPGHQGFAAGNQKDGKSVHGTMNLEKDKRRKEKKKKPPPEKEMSSVEPAAGGGGRGRTGRGRGWGHLRPLGAPPRGRLPPSAPRLHAGFPYFVLPFGLTVNKKAGGRGRGWLLSLVPN